MTQRELARQIAGVATLDEPVRRELYLYVAGRPRPVGREEAAKAAGVSWALAGFHLDRLAAEGLLDVSFRRLSGRRGPGAGRPAKLYQRSARQLVVTVPERRYELAARLFAQALEQAGEPVGAAMRAGARRFGRTLGVAVRERAGRRAGGAQLLARLEATLGDAGYAPVRDDDGTIRMRNCPFDALASEHRELVCGMNLALIGGVLVGCRARGVKAVLEPQPGMCCVAVRKAGGR